MNPLVHPTTEDAASGDETRAETQSELLHKLRTPLNQILGYSEMLEEQALADGRDGYVQDLRKIHKAGGHLLDLINQSFQASPVEASHGLRSVGAARSSDSPNAPESDGLQVSDGQVAARAAHGRLMVVDDNEANRDVLSKRLKLQGHDVVSVEGGREALAMLRVQPFDLVLLDIMMPHMDGYEVLKRIKGDAALRHIPVIMVTALDELDSIVRCIEMGADDYLAKPFNPTLLKARVGSCLEKKKSHDLEIELFMQLQRSYQRLREVERLRDDLTHMIVHDLRTPLASVFEGIQALDAVPNLTQLQQEKLNISLGAGETVIGMIGDLLNIEKLESGTMQLDRSLLSATTLVGEAVDQVAAQADNNDQALINKANIELPKLLGDEKKLVRMLVYLLGNAMNVTPSKGTITVDVHCSSDGKSLGFSISDTGKAIAGETSEEIFEKFGQGEPNQGGNTMSTGLGLTFCKLVVEAHGGKIKAESTPDVGRVFSFAIPVAPSFPVAL